MINFATYLSVTRPFQIIMQRYWYFRGTLKIQLSYSSDLRIRRKQIDRNANNVSKEQLRSNRVIALLNQCKKRKKHVKAMSYQEKVESSFAPFMLVQEVPRIEESLFNSSSHLPRFALASLRNRYVFLQTVFGILRGESIFKCDLSDLCDLIKTQEGITSTRRRYSLMK